MITAKSPGPPVDVPYKLTVGGGRIFYEITAGAAKGVTVWYWESAHPSGIDVQVELLKLTVEYEGKLKEA